jgi:hypothetical protein
MRNDRLRIPDSEWVESKAIPGVPDPEFGISIGSCHKLSPILQTLSHPLDNDRSCRVPRSATTGDGSSSFDHDLLSTGWGQEEDKRRSREAGFNFHMVKPVEPAALERLLAGLLAPA